jgi:hypothetical protein
MFASSSLHPANSIFLSHKTSINNQHQPASSTFLSQKISTSHQHQPAEHSEYLFLQAEERLRVILFSRRLRLILVQNFKIRLLRMTHHQKTFEIMDEIGPPNA